MSTALSSIIATVRGIIVDQIDDATIPAFTDAEIAKAVNSTVGGFFGFRPEAFSVGSIVTEVPDELSEIGRSCLGFTRAGTYADFSDISAAFLGAALTTGKISLNFKTDRTGGLLFFGDSATVHTALLVEATGLRLINSDTPALNLQLLGAFTDNEWHTVEINLASGSVTMTVGSEASTVAYAGSLIADPSLAYLGRVVIGTDEYGFEGYMSGLIISDENSRELIRYNMDDGSGSVLFNSANYNTGLPDVVRIVCTADPLFDGDYGWNEGDGAWEKGNYFCYKLQGVWILTDGITTFHAPDNGLSTPPATFYRTLEYPLTITVVGAGGEEFNKDLLYAGVNDSRPFYTEDGTSGYPQIKIGYHEEWLPGPTLRTTWEAYDHLGLSRYSLIDPSALPPKTGWLYFGEEFAPAPTLEYTLEAEAATTSTLSATIYSDPVEWIEDAPLNIARWAVQQFCYGVAAFLLSQRGKDSFYRKAADALNRLYMGR